MNAIALLQPFQGFDVSIGSEVYKGFRVVEEWHGMKELRDEQGRVLIVDVAGGPFTQTFAGVAAVFGNDPKLKAIVVKASPELLEAVAKENAS